LPGQANSRDSVANANYISFEATRAGALSTPSSCVASIIAMMSITRASVEEQGNFARTVVDVRLPPNHTISATSLAVGRRD
jgi:hypothetical protein